MCILTEISKGIQILHSQFLCYGEKCTILKVLQILTDIARTTRPVCSKVQNLHCLQHVQHNPCVIFCAAIVNFDKRSSKKWLTISRHLKGAIRCPFARSLPGTIRLASGYTQGLALSQNPP